MKTLAELIAYNDKGEAVWTQREPVPAYVLTTGLREYLFAAASMLRLLSRRSENTPPFRYMSVEELVLFCGRQAEQDILKHEHFPDMTLGRCFENAYEVSQANPGWCYTEGWGFMEGSIPTHHAWLTGPSGEIADPTWAGLMRNNGDRFPFPVGRVAYAGVSICPAQHRKWFELRGYPNILNYCDTNNTDVMQSGMEYFDAL